MWTACTGRCRTHPPLAMPAAKRGFIDTTSPNPRRSAAFAVVKLVQTGFLRFISGYRGPQELPMSFRSSFQPAPS